MGLANEPKNYNFFFYFLLYCKHICCFKLVVLYIMQFTGLEWLPHARAGFDTSILSAPSYALVSAFIPSFMPPHRHSDLGNPTFAVARNQATQVVSAHFMIMP